jgi:hypothetical protein
MAPRSRQRAMKARQHIGHWSRGAKSLLSIWSDASKELVDSSLDLLSLVTEEETSFSCYLREATNTVLAFQSNQCSAWLDFYRQHCDPTSAPPDDEETATDDVLFEIDQYCECMDPVPVLVPPAPFSNLTLTNLSGANNSSLMIAPANLRLSTRAARAGCVYVGLVDMKPLLMGQGALPPDVYTGFLLLAGTPVARIRVELSVSECIDASEPGGTPS